MLAVPLTSWRVPLHIFSRVSAPMSRIDIAEKLAASAGLLSQYAPTLGRRYAPLPASRSRALRLLDLARRQAGSRSLRGRSLFD